jgi:hypothetical protein
MNRRKAWDEQKKGLHPHGLGTGPSVAGYRTLSFHHLHLDGVASGVRHGKERDGYCGEHLSKELPHERVLLEEPHPDHVVMGPDELVPPSHSIGLAHVGGEFGERGVRAEIADLRDRIDEEVVEVSDDPVLRDQLRDGVQPLGLLDVA